jgi:hypothetical protein
MNTVAILMGLTGAVWLACREGWQTMLAIVLLMWANNIMLNARHE